MPDETAPPSPRDPHMQALMSHGHLVGEGVGERWDQYTYGASSAPATLDYMGARHRAAVSVAIGHDHNSESCALCAAAGAAVDQLSQPIEPPPPMQFPRDWVSPWVGIMARAELRAELVAKVRESIVGAAYTDDIHWATLDAMADAAVDVLLREGQV